ncbi:15233_t:CDS:1 [Funneliformis geosporum]|nr:15233_t:CDS:1 [Funneliformis geosporum]
MWQHATITFAENSDFKKLVACNRIFVLNDMVRVHGCDLPKKDILAKSKFSAKLVGLLRFTTRKQLLDIGYMVNTIAWIIPKARSNYHNLQHAFFYFFSAEDIKVTLSNENLTINDKHVTWTAANAKLCAICLSPHHKASDCLKRRK